MVYLRKNKPLAVLPRPERPQLNCIIAGSPSELKVSEAAEVLFALYTQGKKNVKNCMKLTFSVKFSSLYLPFPHYCSSLLLCFICIFPFARRKRNPSGTCSSPSLAHSRLSITTWRSPYPLRSSRLPLPCSTQPFLVWWSFPITLTSPPACSTPALLPVCCCCFPACSRSPGCGTSPCSATTLETVASPEPSLQAPCRDKFPKECLRLHSDDM